MKENDNGEKVGVSKVYKVKYTVNLLPFATRGNLNRFMEILGDSEDTEIFKAKTV